MVDSVIVQEPAQAAQLILLFHGVGSTAHPMALLGQRLGWDFPNAAIVSVAAPFESDMGSGLQWFSVRGVTEENRAARVAAAMPHFTQAVHGWQERFQVAPAATVLAGFSQGAIMALESARLGQGLAGRIGALAGRFAVLPDTAPANTTFHLIHGDSDGVISSQNAIDGAQRLKALGAPVTLDVLPYTGHEVPGPMAALLARRLKEPAVTSGAGAAPR